MKSEAPFMRLTTTGSYDDSEGMGESAANDTPRRIPGWLGPALIYALSIGCLIWVYRDFNFRAEWPRVRAIHWAWIVLAVSCDILVYVIQAWRWNLVLRPVVQAPLGRSVQAVYIGLFANELLPMRSGEAIRTYLQAKWSRIPFGVSVSSAIIERFVDGVWLILGFFLTTFFVKVDGKLKVGAWILAGMVAVVALLLLYSILRKEEAHDWLEKYRWLKVFRHLVEGLHVMGRAPSFFLAAGASLIYLGLQVVPIFAIIRGYGLDLSFGHAAVVLVVLRLGTVIPGPPGNIGFFNAFATAALMMMGVQRQVAKGLSGVMFILITLPLLLAGIVALALTGLKLRELQRQARTQMQIEEPVKT